MGEQQQQQIQAVTQSVACSFFVDIDMSIIPVVDLHLYCHFQCISAITCEFRYWYFAINVEYSVVCNIE
jgi:hypothetical protein